MLIWQDMPSGGGEDQYLAGTSQYQAIFPSETLAEQQKQLSEMVGERRALPSIVTWVINNEGWGQYDSETLARFVKGSIPRGWSTPIRAGSTSRRACRTCSTSTPMRMCRGRRHCRPTARSCSANMAASASPCRAISGNRARIIGADRKGVASGTGVAGSVDPGGRRNHKKKKQNLP